MSVQKVGNHSHSDDLSSLVNNLGNFPIFQAHHILSIDFQEIMVDEETIARSWRVHNDSGDLTDFELKTNMTGGILVERQSSLKWSGKKRLGELLRNVAL